MFLINKIFLEIEKYMFLINKIFLEIENQYLVMVLYALENKRL